MILILRAIELNDERLSQPIVGRFDESGGTIGRADSNTMMLPDPERLISRVQARVSCNGAQFFLDDVGTSNPVLLNGRAIGSGQRATLRGSDELQIGGYRLRAEFDSDDESKTITRGRVTGPGPMPSAPIPDLASAPDPFADFGKPLGAPAPAASAVAAVPPPAPPARPVAAAPSGNPFADLAGPPSGSGSADPFADLLGSGGAPAPIVGGKTDPFADLLGAPAPATSIATPAPPAAPPATAPLPDFMSPQAGSKMHAPLGAPAPAASARPADIDPFADLAAPAPAPASAAAGSSDPFADLLGGIGGHDTAPGSALDDLLKPSSAEQQAFDPRTGDDPLASFLSAPKPNQSTPDPSLDPLAMFAAPPAAEAPARPAAPDHTSALQGAYVPPKLQGDRVDDRTTVNSSAPAAAAPAAIPDDFSFTDFAVPAPVPVPPAPVARVEASPMPAALTPAPAPQAAPAFTADANAGALWQAFQEGVGVRIDLPQGLTPELMRTVGQMMRHSIEGLLPMIAVRAAAKNELRAKMTMIQSRNNNPLKFAHDANAALSQMLQPPARGFLAGPAALVDAFDDLQSHQIATMTGMRAALEGVLGRFDPAPLEGRLAKGSLDGILPMNRRSKLWELYLEHYKSLRAEAEDDFHELFGKAFVEAYEAQIDRLDRSRGTSGH
ncbi:hypothetical protein BH09PSE6_BH09PSE6_16410 [soil metagenome]